MLTCFFCLLYMVRPHHRLNTIFTSTDFVHQKWQLIVAPNYRHFGNSKVFILAEPTKLTNMALNLVLGTHLVSLGHSFLQIAKGASNHVSVYIVAL